MSQSPYDDTGGIGDQQGRLRIRSGALEVLEWSPCDASDLFEVRNHESVRSFMPNPAPLDYSEHLQWLEKNVRPGGSLRIFLVRLAGLPIGFTICRKLGAGDLELGVLFREPEKHLGMPAQAAALMIYVAFNQYNARQIVTYVNRNHLRALQFNRGFGLKEVSSNRPNELCLRATAHQAQSNLCYRRIMSRLRRTMVIDWLVGPEAWAGPM